MSNGNSTHAWKFFRAGGFDQVRLDSANDLANLAQLDPKLWVALACPASGLEFDSKTLALIDTDKDGRIRVPEIIAVTQWACGCLKNASDLRQGAASLPLSAINDATPEGRQLLSSAKHILANLGKPTATAITVEDTTDTAKIFAAWNLNGDGIVPADAADDAALKALITDIIACFGAETDRSGKPGVSQAKADQFFTEAVAYSDWWKKAEGDPAVLPLGQATAAAVAAVGAVRAKVDDYFTRCRLAAFDPRALTALNREEKDYLALTAKELTISASEIAAFPLSHVEAGRPLPLTENVNPAWAAALAKFQADAVKPILGERATLTEDDWAGLLAKFAPFTAWSAAKAGAPVEKLGLPRIREILGGNLKDALTALIAKDKALEPEATSIAAVDKLVRCHRDLYRLLNNFVSFHDFYGRKDKAIFQAGTLYLDTRSCDLCLRVEDSARHGAMAALSRTYLAYCDCVRKATGEKMTIAAAFTDGDSDNLIVGRNGVFYDRQGRDWDATIVKIVENPISIRQAFWAPYKKLMRFIEDQVAKRASAADAAATDKLTTAATTTATAATTGKAPEHKPKIDVGVVAALGVAVGGITAAMGALLQAFFGLGIWMPLGVVAIVLLISGPSMIIAWLKLRQRNLGPLLDANGWAVNAKARINIPFGASLTSVAKLPAGAERDLFDPFAEEKKPWAAWVALAAVVILAFCWWQGKLDGYLWGSMKSTAVMGTNAPAYKPPTLIPATNAPAATK